MKIKSIKKIHLETAVPVYDLTVDSVGNFCLASGIVVHNSKDVADAVAGVVYNIISDPSTCGTITATCA